MASRAPHRRQIGQLLAEKTSIETRLREKEQELTRLNVARDTADDWKTVDVSDDRGSCIDMRGAINVCCLCERRHRLTPPPSSTDAAIDPQSRPRVT